MSNSSQSEYEVLSVKYADLSKTGISPSDFYLHLHNDGVSKMNIFLLLQDQYSLSLVEFRNIAEEVEKLINKTE